MVLRSNSRRSRVKSQQKTRALPKILIFGENLHDSRSIEHLLLAANNKLERRVKALPRPVSLTRDAGTPAVRDWVKELRRTVLAFEGAGNDVAAVLIHRDADGPDKNGRQEILLAEQIRSISKTWPVVPVQSIEAWWFLFPDAVEAVCPVAWRRKLPRRVRNVEGIDGPKYELQRVTSRGGSRSYQEADSIDIAASIRKLGAATMLGHSASFVRFGSLARSIK